MKGHRLSTALLRPVFLSSRCKLYSSKVVTPPIPQVVIPEDVSPSPPVPPSPTEINQLARFISTRQKLIVITGAGCSTESGVPDYRSPNGSYSKGHKPTTYQEFVQKPLAAKRFWARSMFGYVFFQARDPNPTHKALVALENEGKIHHLITQNVDRLHHKAGQQKVIELHGNNDTVKCLKCHTVIERADFQAILQAANPNWMTIYRPRTATSRPDGDAELGEIDYSKFVVPDCDKCGGMIKPDVVFFGENVPIAKVQKAMDLVNESDGVLAIGTSLQVFSVFRYVKAAAQKNIPVAILNIGPTRADDMENLEFKVEGRSGEVLPLVLAKIIARDIREPVVQY